MSLKIANFPSIPSTHFISEDKILSTDINNYKTELIHLLNEIFNRSDCFNFDLLRDFFQFDSNNKNKVNNQMILTSENNFECEICDVYYDNSLNIVIFGGGYSNNFLNSENSFNLNAIFNFFDNKSQYGQLSIYKLTNANYGEKKLEIMYKKNFPQCISKIKYYKETNSICIGFFDGSISIFEYKNNIMTNISQLHPHSHKVLNFYLDQVKGYLYSLAEGESDLAISEITYQNVIAKEKLTSTSVSAFEYIPQGSRIIIIDYSGFLSLYQVKDYLTVSLIQVVHTDINDISALHINVNGAELIFLGSSNQIDLYEIINGNIIVIKHKLKLVTGFKCTALYYDSIRFILYTGMSNGTLQVWSHSKEIPEYVKECYVNQNVSCLSFDSNNIIITGSKEKIAKVWQVPNKFYSEILRSNQLINEEFAISLITQGFNSINTIKNAFALMAVKDDAKENKENKKDLNKNKIDDIEKEDKTDLIIEDDGEKSLDGWDEFVPYSLNESNANDYSNDSIMNNIIEKYSLFKSFIWN